MSPTPSKGNTWSSSQSAQRVQTSEWVYFMLRKRVCKKWWTTLSVRPLFQDRRKLLLSPSITLYSFRCIPPSSSSPLYFQKVWMGSKADWAGPRQANVWLLNTEPLNKVRARPLHINTQPMALETYWIERWCNRPLGFLGRNLAQVALLTRVISGKHRLYRSLFLDIRTPILLQWDIRHRRFSSEVLCLGLSRQYLVPTEKTKASRSFEAVGWIVFRIHW